MSFRKKRQQLTDLSQNLAINPYKRDNWAVQIGDIFMCNGMPERVKQAMEDMAAERQVRHRSDDLGAQRSKLFCSQLLCRFFSTPKRAESVGYEL